MNEKQLRDDLAKFEDNLNLERLKRHKRTIHQIDSETWLQLRIILKFDPYKEETRDEKGKEEKS